MSAIFDTSVVISISSTAEPHHQWSVEQFRKWKEQGPVIVNDIVYAELSSAMPSKMAVDQLVARLGLERLRTSDAALFAAGQRYVLHLRNGGTRKNVLPDFFIGADGQDIGLPLVTANPDDFLGFFTGLHVVHPAGEFVVQ